MLVEILPLLNQHSTSSPSLRQKIQRRAGNFQNVVKEDLHDLMPFLPTSASPSGTTTPTALYTENHDNETELCTLDVFNIWRPLAVVISASSSPIIHPKHTSYGTPLNLAYAAAGPFQRVVGGSQYSINHRRCPGLIVPVHQLLESNTTIKIGRIPWETALDESSPSSFFVSCETGHSTTMPSNKTSGIRPAGERTISCRSMADSMMKT